MFLSSIWPFYGGLARGLPALAVARFFAHAIYTLLRCFLTISMKCEAFSGQSGFTVRAEAQKNIFFAYSIKTRVIHGCRRKALGVNGVNQAYGYLGPLRGLSGTFFSSTWRSTIATAYRSLGQPRFSLGFFCGLCISWLFPSQKSILAVTGLRPFPGPGEGGPPKANSTRCFLWSLLFLGRFPR